jgi:Xaa-Pro aminopeptidase
MERILEFKEKLFRVRNFMGNNGIKAMLIKKQPNFSWLTAGGLNMVSVATEIGVTSLLVTLSDHYVISNRIEAQRMMNEEELASLKFKLLSYEWYEDKEAELVREAAGDGKIGCDVGVGGYINVDAHFKELRYELTQGEIDRYLFMGGKLSTAIEKVLLDVKPEETEAEITGRLCAELWKDRIDPVGYMAAADDRARLYRHPIPTMNRVKKYMMLCINARYKGLVTTITRLAHFGDVPISLQQQYRENVEIECIMIANTRIGEEIRTPLMAAIEAYKKIGLSEEWKLHHQGGSMGYYGRDIRVTPINTELIRKNQAFCWNPTISGTKSEDGFIVTPDGPVMITNPVLFPNIRLEMEDYEFVRPAILSI